MAKYTSLFAGYATYMYAVTLANNPELMMLHAIFFILTAIFFDRIEESDVND